MVLGAAFSALVLLLLAVDLGVFHRTAHAVSFRESLACQDHTTRMRSYARRRVEELAEDELCGYVLKKDSPTCGLERVKVYGTAGVPARSVRGLFADALVTRFPLLLSKKKGGSTIRGCGRTSSNAYLPILGSTHYLPHGGRWVTSYGSNTTLIAHIFGHVGAFFRSLVTAPI